MYSYKKIVNNDIQGKIDVDWNFNYNGLLFKIHKVLLLENETTLYMFAKYNEKIEKYYSFNLSKICVNGNSLDNNWEISNGYYEKMSNEVEEFVLMCGSKKIIDDFQHSGVYFIKLSLKGAITKEKFKSLDFSISVNKKCYINKTFQVVVGELIEFYNPLSLKHHKFSIISINSRNSIKNFKYKIEPNLLQEESLIINSCEKKQIEKKDYLHNQIGGASGEIYLYKKNTEQSGVYTHFYKTSLNETNKLVIDCIISRGCSEKSFNFLSYD